MQDVSDDDAEDFGDEMDAVEEEDEEAEEEKPKKVFNHRLGSSLHTNPISFLESQSCSQGIPESSSQGKSCPEEEEGEEGGKRRG